MQSFFFLVFGFLGGQQTAHFEETRFYNLRKRFGINCCVRSWPCIIFKEVMLGKASEL
jgi:hypothetical protein